MSKFVQYPSKVTLTMPLNANIDGRSYEFKLDVDVTAEVERLPYETLINLWNARSERHPMEDVSSEPFIAALVMRLMRGQSIGVIGQDVVIYDHYANSREQSTAT